MRILIVANHFCVCSARYMTDALKRLGHEVIHVGPAMGRSIWGLELSPEYVWTPDDTEIKIEYYKPTDDPVNRPWNFEPDLTIVMDSDPAILDNPKLASIQKLNSTPVIVYGVDNHVRDYRRPYFEHYFLAHRNVSVMDWQYKPHEVTFHDSDMTWLPCGYDPVLHTPSPIPFAERQYDVACLGVMYPRRIKLVKALIAAGYKVLWGTGLVGEAYRDAHHNSRIALCASSNGDVGQRVFESAAMGNVVLSDNCPDFQLLKPDGFYLPDGGDMLTPENVVTAVSDILADPTRAQENIEKSKAWVRGNSWDDRVRVIVEWYQKQRDDFDKSTDEYERWKTEHPEQYLEALQKVSSPSVQVAGNGEAWDTPDGDE